MKILQVGLGNNPGGIEAFVMNYYRELAKRGISFDFVSMYGKIAFESEILSLSGRVFYVPNVKKDPFGYIRGMRALLKRERYDVVHVHMLSAANILPLKLAREAGVPMVIAHSHNTGAPGILRRAMDAANRPKISRYASKKLACSEAAARWLFGDTAYEAGNVAVLQNAIDPAGFFYDPGKRAAIRREFKIPENAFVIGHVGRFQVQKNQEKLVDILAELEKRRPDVRLLMAGDGQQREMVKQKAIRQGVGEKTIFAGVRLDIGALLCAMDVFVLPSLFEGLGIAAIEAQANGLPCLVSAGVPDEAVLFSDTVKKLSLEESALRWADQILSLQGKRHLDAAFLQERMKERRFDIHTEAARLLEIYGGLDEAEN